MNEISLSEKLTYSTVLLKAIINDQEKWRGTGFIINICENKESQTCVPIIVTNKHVVKDSDLIEFEFCEQNQNGTPNDLNAVKIRIDSKNCYFHPSEEVDLCCFPIAQILNLLEIENKKVFYIPLTASIIPSEDEILDFSASEDISMIGYPIGLSDTYNHKPIIRRGITATHLKKNYLGKKEFLVDMACYPGSSGSPIFILNEGAYTKRNSLVAGGRIKLIGILYAGPLFNAQGQVVIYSNPNIATITDIPINLGIAIKAQRILDFEIFFKS